ncbi:MAG TPA: universal stress protein [Rhodanobacteraceae bacterium]|nr:universal stress protein [Rhodanobacteraceae bacterium]
MIKQTLVGYDSSDSAKHCFRFALDLMRATGGHVHVVSVVQVTEGGPEACAMMMSDKGADRVGELQAELAALAPNDTDLFDVEVVYGSPGDVLLAQVEQHGIDHIVIGHTERGALLRWLLGSVSSDIIARAHVPVTVVR